MRCRHIIGSSNDNGVIAIAPMSINFVAEFLVGCAVYMLNCEKCDRSTCNDRQSKGKTEINDLYCSCGYYPNRKVKSKAKSKT